MHRVSVIKTNYVWKKYQQIYERVQHELRTVSPQAAQAAIAESRQ